jgi:hypothetical protein
MYAQVVQGGARLEDRRRMDRIVVDQALPALQQEPGFVGALNLVDRATGHGMMIMLWETEAEARRPLPEYGQPFQEALAAIMAVSTGERAPISVWEVNARS